MVESTITRLTQFLANEWLYRVLYQAKGTIKFYELIESGKTIIFYLPIGKLGEEPAPVRLSTFGETGHYDFWPE